MVPLVTVMCAYAGPYIVFDFDQTGTLVGEIVGEDSNEEDEAADSED